MKNSPFYIRAFWAIFIAGFALRLWYAAFSGLELAPDEAYYWQWSRNLDWSYYSKGPLVAYLIYLGTLVGGNTEFGVRLPTLLLSAYTLWISYLLYGKLYPGDSRGLFLTALFYHAIPVFLVGGMIATIDPPFCALWLTGTYALDAAARERKSWGWVLLAFALGLGILAKYTMLLFLFTPILFLTLSKENRHWLKRPEPYCALLGGLLFFLIPIIWNTKNDWVSLRHNLNLSKIDAAFVWQKSLLHFPEMVAVQAGIISPVLFILLVWGIVAHTRKTFSGPINQQGLLLVCSFAPVLLFYTLLSIKRSINPNWIIAIYPAVILAASRFWSTQLEKGKGVYWIASGGCLGALFCVVLLFSDMVHIINLPNSQQIDPAARLKGWTEFAALTEETLEQFTEPERVFIFGNKYQTASELAFYLPAQPRTYAANDHPLSNQYDIWGGSKELLGHDAVFALRVKKESDLFVPDHISQSFSRIEPGLQRAAERYGAVIRYHKTWKCYGFKGWAIQTELEQINHSL